MHQMSPRLIVGLGNPGEKYANTRHNIGFMIVDRLLERCGAAEHRSLSAVAWAARSEHNGNELFFLKPLTFMNRSGVAVEISIQQLAVVPTDVLVVYDCLDLPFGRLRIRRQGGSGGHRGLESVLHSLQTDNVPRLRVGIGRPQGETVDYVLSGWSNEELESLSLVVDAAADAVLECIDSSLEAAMNQYNGWTLPSDSSPTSEHKE